MTNVYFEILKNNVAILAPNGKHNMSVLKKVCVREWEREREREHKWIDLKNWADQEYVLFMAFSTNI